MRSENCHLRIWAARCLSDQRCPVFIRATCDLPQYRIHEPSPAAAEPIPGDINRGGKSRMWWHSHRLELVDAQPQQDPQRRVNLVNWPVSCDLSDRVVSALHP